MPKKVLFVDEGPNIIKNIEKRQLEAGVSLTPVSDAEIAFEEFVRHTFD